MRRHCPICKTLTESLTNAEFPFCSARCRLQDLSNWAAEKYVVSEPIFDEDDNERNESARPDDPEH
jgi:uncharacterized protein